VIGMIDGKFLVHRSEQKKSSRLPAFMFHLSFCGRCRVELRKKRKARRFGVLM
jgi:hypothetical protein